MKINDFISCLANDYVKIIAKMEYFLTLSRQLNDLFAHKKKFLHCLIPHQVYYNIKYLFPISALNIYLNNYLTCTRTRPFGAYWYEFLASIFIATWSFQANSSAFCHGASVLARRNLILVPIWKHCQTGLGKLAGGAPPKDHKGEAGVSYVPTAGGGRIL